MLLTVVVAIVVLVFVIESLLDYLNQSRAHAPIPAEVAHLYDEKERSTSINYGYEKYRLGLISSSLMTAVTILALTQGWLAALDSWVRGFTSNTVLLSLIFLAALSVISSALELPFNLYSIFSIEERFGFNKVTPRTFLLDLIKGTLVSVVVAGPVLALIIWLYVNFAEKFWLYGWLLVAAFSLFTFMFGTRLILPLFN
ncbi:MAG: M48 family peptidase, partial [Actinobacteria bacterium]|nr:M48 family peptidase [Actinomycetota bacterium]